MRFFFASLKCWLVHGGHCWSWQHLTFIRPAAGKPGNVMRCIKCGAECASRTNQVGVK